MNLGSESAEEFRRDSWKSVLLLQHEWNLMGRRVSERETRSVSTGTHDARRRLAPYLAGDRAPGAERSAKGLPVLPWTRAIERMEVKQLEGKSRLRQHVALDPTSGANEKRLDARIGALQSACDGETRVEVSARAPARENHPHRAGSARSGSGSVAAAPNTFSRELPMFTSIPVMTSERTRLERPYEMNGSVSPVVGSNPVATPM